MGSSNSLLPDGTKPLPKPMLTCHQWGPVTTTYGQFHKRYFNYQPLKLAWKLLIQNFIQTSQRPKSQCSTEWPFLPSDVSSSHRRDSPKLKLSVRDICRFCSPCCSSSLQNKHFALEYFLPKKSLQSHMPVLYIKCWCDDAYVSVN